jgi:Cu/Zn superoxide dismutase
MRNTRFVVALAAVACAAALPAAAVAHKGQPAHHGHPGKGKSGDATVVRLAPVGDQKARGAVQLKQRTGALSVALRVSGLTPGAFYASHLHSGACSTLGGATVVTFPDIYADEHGVATLVTTVPTGPTDNFVATGLYVDVHKGPTGGDLTEIACGDVNVKPQKSAAVTFLRGANHEHGRAELVQKGSDVSVWISISGLTPGAHAVHLHAGSCKDAAVAITLSLGDITADPDGNASMKIASSSTSPVVGKGYSLDVHAAASSVTAGNAVVACGDLFPVGRHGHFHK